jgi:mersacidin/lichenicidin family type 2 lantibiotic
MQEIDKIIRAWKDDDYRMSLSDDELRGLPENPVGLIEFSGADLNHAAGTFFSSGVKIIYSIWCC